jgi:hypothetical protein
LDLTGFTNDELDVLINDVYLEKTRRATLTSIPDSIDILNRNYLAAEGTVPGQEWRQPIGAYDAYPLDWVVLHGGKTWTSTVAWNVGEPGVSSWREVVPEGAPPPEWTQPDSTNPYMKGARVTFEGAVYTSTIDNNVWSPAGYPAGWAIDPA